MNKKRRYEPYRFEVRWIEGTFVYFRVYKREQAARKLAAALKSEGKDVILASLA